jgi:[ribosomal protein S5]-alanine N-acetyltransferase
MEVYAYAFGICSRYIEIRVGEKGREHIHFLPREILCTGPIMQIVTRSAILRNWTIGDAPALSRHADDPRIARWMRDAFPSPYTLEDARRFISMATGETQNLFLAIEADGEARGGIGIHPLDDVKRRSAEIGYWLSASCRGRGIATDAVRALVPVAFSRYDIVRLQAGIFSGNDASIRVLERCGFIREAVHKNAITKNGMLHDEIVYVFTDEMEKTLTSPSY